MTGTVGVAAINGDGADEQPVCFDREDPGTVVRYLRHGALDVLALARSAEEALHFVGAHQRDVSISVPCLGAAQGQPSRFDGVRRPGHFSEISHAPHVREGKLICRLPREPAGAATWNASLG